MPAKSDIRRTIAACLAQPPDVRAAKSAQLCEAILAMQAWRDAATVVIFAPQSREPDVEMLWPHAAGKSLAYPRVNAGRLDIFRVASVYDLLPGAFGIREPSDAPENAVAPGDIDLILVPGVAFTRAGLRLGRGGGFYDRLLAGLPASTIRIGVCFASQVLDELPVEPHDQRVDFVATEEGILTPG